MTKRPKGPTWVADDLHSFIGVFGPVPDHVATMRALLGRAGTHVVEAANVSALAHPPGPAAVEEAEGRRAHHLVSVPFVDGWGVIVARVDTLEAAVATAEEGLVGAGQLHPVTAGHCKGVEGEGISQQASYILYIEC